MFELEQTQLGAVRANLDEVFRKVEAFVGFKPNCYFAGGCIASLVLKETPNDYDLWFYNLDDFEKVKASVFWSQTSDTPYSTTVVLPSGEKIQFVKSRIGLPSEVVPTFDFQHTQSFYIPDGELSVDVPFIESKQLILKGNLDHPLNTFQRVLKFTKRGYEVPNDTLLSLMSGAKVAKEKGVSFTSGPAHGGSV